MNYPFLKFTDQGAEVKLLQNLLNKAGSFNLTEDGIFGEQTYNAVKEYQRIRELSIDGCVGDKTWAKLLQETGQIQAANNNQVATAGFGQGVNLMSLGIMAAIGLGLWIIINKLREG